MILTTEKSDGYELIDSGDGEKLERFGGMILRRPDPEVLWKKMKSDDVWNSAHAQFVRTETGGKWNIRVEIKKEWNVKIEDTDILLKIQKFKHVGIFPEQIEQWKWMVDRITKNEIRNTDKKVKVLNLFGYTGVASVAFAQAGAEVTHVDSVDATVKWAQENATLNNISNIRFIVDDARKFVEREIKRGAIYDAILMDPPVYGRGTQKKKGDEWNIGEDFLPLLARSAELLSNTPVFFVVNGYASEYSHLAYKNALEGGVMYEKKIESGELALKESDTDRLLPAGIFARASF
jgi:23S rRNA (cytosine1962-C5)-methyltransferase